MKRNKIISFVCALAMVMSMFSAFTVVNAAGEHKITTTAEMNGDNAVVTVSYSGFTAVNGIQLTIPFSDEIFDISKATTKATLGSTSVSGTDLNVVFLAIAEEQYGGAESQIVEVTIPVKDKSKLPVDIELKGVQISEADPDGNDKSYGTSDVKNDFEIVAENGTLVDPSVTPTPTPRPTAPPRPTAKPVTTPDPSATPAPTKKPVVTEGHRISGTATMDGDNAVITVSYAGFTAVNGIQLTIPFSDEIFDISKATTKATLGSTSVSGTDLNVVFLAIAEEQYGGAESQIVEVTIPVKDKSKLPVDIELKGVQISEADPDGNDKSYGTPDVKNDFEIAVNEITLGGADEPEATPTPLPDNTEIAIEDYVADDAFDNAAAAEKEDKETYMTIVLKDKDDKVVVDSTATDATSVDNNYGKTFVATWDGEELTADEFQDIINGYDENRPISKAKGSLKLNIFNDSGITNVSTTVNAYDPATGTAEQISDPVDNEPIESEEPEDPTRPSYKVSPARKTVDGGDTVNITATLTKADYPDGYIKVSVTNLDPVSGSGITVKTADDKAVLSGGTDVVYLEAGNDSTVKVEVSFKASAAKTEDSLKLTFDYVDAKNDNGASLLGANAKNNTSTITVRKQSTSSSSSSSGSGSGTKSSGGNTLAQGNLSGTTVEPVGTFKDINDAPWAAAAITTLASQGIVSGRGDGTFDPNANITRAEYCQILINAIEKSAEYADASFNDVPTDAWFYHAVAVASKYDIVEGYGDGNFGPYDLITREQMALMTLKAAQVMNVNLSATTSASFSDDAAIADWSRNAVYTLANAGIINGMDDGTFAPQANATRAQAAVIIYNTFVK